jgi:acetyltransferase-like isoleucine patch superfamily enzyme
MIGYRLPSDEPGEIELGEGALVRSGSVLYSGSCIGARLETGHNVVIRERCQIGADVRVWSNSVIDYGCRVGNGVKIHCNCYLAQYTELDDNVFLAPGVTIANDLYPGQADSAAMMSGPLIGAGAQIGVNVTILPMVRIGPGALIGAGAVVARDIPAGCVAYGNPATVRGLVADLVAIGKRVEPVDRSGSRYRFAGPAGSTSATGGEPP